MPRPNRVPPREPRIPAGVFPPNEADPGADWQGSYDFVAGTPKTLTSDKPESQRREPPGPARGLRDE